MSFEPNCMFEGDRVNGVVQGVLVFLGWWEEN